MQEYLRNKIAMTIYKINIIFPSRIFQVQQHIYATLEGRYDSMQKMVYYKMPIERKKKPGQNYEWIKLLSELENSITHHPKINICAETWHEYVANLQQLISTEITMGTSSPKKPQAID